ncbi:MAG: response regulator transcription factor [Lachnospiraceae bacterium]|nr:response regulator transcription factor [Lachnospiraceae bacterium]
MTKRILIVEDEDKIARFLELELVHEGYEVVKKYDGRSGLEAALSGGFSLMILDIMLPGINGLEVLRRLRKTSELPVIMLTARDQVMDKVNGLDMGADDYMTKPFAVEELLARIRLVLRKHAQGTESSVGSGHIHQVRNLVMDEAAHTVRYQGKEIQLTNKEFQLLRELMINCNVVLSRETILNNVWGYDYVGETNVVDVYVRFLRQKIDDAVGEKFILTVRGVGYVIKDEYHE